MSAVTESRGSLSVELVVLTPVLIFFVLVVLSMGRYELAREQVLGAARAAAQSAALSPSASQAQAAALGAAAPIVRNDLRSCTALQVVTDTSDFVPGGSVRVTVSCRVDYADLLVPGVPGGHAVQAEVTAPIDPYRSVG